MTKVAVVFAMTVLWLGIVGSLPANAASSGNGTSLKTSPSVAIITITFETNLPKTGAPWDAYSKDQKSLGTGKVKP